MVSGGNQGEGGGAGFSTSRGNSEKIDCQSYGIIRTLQSLMGGGMGGGGGGAEESLIVTHPRDKWWPSYYLCYLCNKTPMHTWYGVKFWLNQAGLVPLFCQSQK